VPAVEIQRPTSASPAAAWAFVSDMDWWAPLLTGYQSHEQIDDRRSRWTVRGELGGLTRLAEFDVVVTEWVEPARIAFTLEGRDDPFSGSGTFAIAPAGGRAEAPTSSSKRSRLGTQR
jgi:carbon monoxide dehydrogenase subunit G